MENIKKQLEAIKGKVNNVNVNELTFENSKSVFSFELTKTGKVKKDSIKFLWTIASYSNCSY